MFRMTCPPALAILIVSGATWASEELPVRATLVAQARRWSRLDADRALDVLSNLRAVEARAALRAGPDGVEPFLALWARENPEEIEPIVAAVLGDELPAPRARAARLAGLCKDQDAAAAALPHLEDDSVRVRQAVVETIAAVSPLGAESALREAIAAADAPGDLAMLLSGLAAVATEASLTDVRPLLGDEDPLVRANAARVLARAADPDALADARKRLSVEKEPRVRRELRLAIGAQGDAADVADLKRCLASPIARMDRALCLEALAANPAREATRALAGLLDSKGSDLRREAAMALSQRDDEEARTGLLAYAAKEEDPNVLRFVLTSLGRLKEPRAVERLKLGLADPNIALFCALALAELGDPSGAAILRVSLEDRDYRERSINGLSRLRDRKASAAAVTKAHESDNRPAIRAIALAFLSEIP